MPRQILDTFNPVDPSLTYSMFYCYNTGPAAQREHGAAT